MKTRKIQDNNKSGYTGVRLKNNNGYQHWIATMSYASATPGKRMYLYKGFSADKYGHEAAKAMAVEQRREWEHMRNDGAFIYE